MLTANVDVSDGLVNGSRGEVVHIVTTKGYHNTYQVCLTDRVGLTPAHIVLPSLILCP